MYKGFGLVASVAVALAMMNGGALSAEPPPAGGTISIEPRTGNGDYDPSMPAFVDAASKALTARSFTVFDDPGHAAAVVEMVVSRDDVGTGLAKVPGQQAASLIGTGVSIPLSTGDSQLVPLRRTRLELRIRRRGETNIVWDGTAVTVREAGTRGGTDTAVAADLIQALLEAYPAQPRDVIGVP